MFRFIRTPKSRNTKFLRLSNNEENSTTTIPIHLAFPTSIPTNEPRRRQSFDAGHRERPAHHADPRTSGLQTAFSVRVENYGAAYLAALNKPARNNENDESKNESDENQNGNANKNDRSYILRSAFFLPKFLPITASPHIDIGYCNALRHARHKPTFSQERQTPKQSPSCRVPISFLIPPCTPFHPSHYQFFERPNHRLLNHLQTLFIYSSPLKRRHFVSICTIAYTQSRSLIDTLGKQMEEDLPAFERAVSVSFLFRVLLYSTFTDDVSTSGNKLYTPSLPPIFKCMSAFSYDVLLHA